jgi:Molecular chaperone GrpE (heat shock protein)
MTTANPEQPEQTTASAANEQEAQTTENQATETPETPEASEVTTVSEPSGEETSTEEVQDPASQLEADLAAAEDKYLRLFAEYDNFRRRTQREKLELSQVATERLIQAFLPLFDDLDRSLFASEKTDNLDKIREGMRIQP